MYHLSRSSSRAANDESEAANAVLDLQLVHLRESTSTSGELSAVAGGMGSRSTTPIPGVSNLHQSSGPVAPIPRSPTPKISLSSNVRSASPSLARMSAAPSAADIAS
jgi:pumilio RNA-binding family